MSNTSTLTSRQNKKVPPYNSKTNEIEDKEEMPSRDMVFAESTTLDSVVNCGGSLLPVHAHSHSTNVDVYAEGDDWRLSSDSTTCVPDQLEDINMNHDNGGSDESCFRIQNVSVIPNDNEEDNMGNYNNLTEKRNQTRNELFAREELTMIEIRRLQQML